MNHLAAAWLLACFIAVGPKPYFTIQVVDEQTGRGVPLVELQTVNNVRMWTDSNGLVAFHEPGLMGQTVWFDVKSHGYEFPKGGFGYRGKALEISEGGSAKLTIKRVNVAERLYRVTGAGIYRDSLLLDQKVPLRQPVLNGLVLGSDSVVNAVYRGKIHWFWGDTNRPAQPLGNFHVPGATSKLPANGGLDPEVGIDLEYFVDAKGFAKETCRMPGEGPTWIGGLVNLREEGDKERLFAGFVKVRSLLDIYEHGLVEFNHEQNTFEKVTAFPEKAPVYPDGHPFHHTVARVPYVYFATPYPLVRVRADAGALRQLEAYESFTCLSAGSRRDAPQLDRGADGRLRYAWKKNTSPLRPAEEAKLVQSGKMKPSEALLQLRDVETDKPVRAHGGSVYWNEFRKRWVMIVLESPGKSILGEVWYAEGDTPLGPWVYARKVVSHDRYSFYNPKQHPFFDKDGGRIIFFEGTYTHTFSGNSEQTPRYDYNQILYKLDLADPRLVLPVPVYASADQPSRLATLAGTPADQALSVAFFAQDRPSPPAIPFYVHASKQRGWALSRKALGNEPPLFWALPAELSSAPPGTVPLFEFCEVDGLDRHYTCDETWSKAGYRKSAQAIARVWKNPLQVILPRE